MMVMAHRVRSDAGSAAGDHTEGDPVRLGALVLPAAAGCGADGGILPPVRRLGRRSPVGRTGSATHFTPEPAGWSPQLHRLFVKKPQNGPARPPRRMAHDYR